MVHIAYKGTGPAMTDMLAGHTSVMAGTMVTTVPQIRAGRLRPLGVTTLERNAAVPEIPTVAEAGLPEDTQRGWRRALFHALSEGEKPPTHRKRRRPADSDVCTLSLFEAMK